MSALPLIKIQDVSFSYEKKTTLQHINLTVKDGDFIAVIGPNGGGKTTLIKLILGLLQPTNGTISVCGQPPGTMNGVVGYVPQHINHNHFFPATSLDVVLMGLFRPQKRLKRLASTKKRKENVQQALRALDQLGIGELATQQIRDLSGGQRQRVLIARALVAGPALLILDEPTASLDTRAQTDFFKLLQKINKDCTILIVSHDLFAVAAYAKSVACVNKDLHYHSSINSSGELIEAFYSSVGGNSARCPVEHLHQQFPARQQENLPNV